MTKEWVAGLASLRPVKLPVLSDVSGVLGISSLASGLTVVGRDDGVGLALLYVLTVPLASEEISTKSHDILNVMKVKPVMS